MHGVCVRVTNLLLLLLFVPAPSCDIILSCDIIYFFLFVFRLMNKQVEIPSLSSSGKT